MSMETINKIERSEMFQDILPIIKKLELKEVYGDSYDHTSIAVELEAFFNKQQLGDWISVDDKRKPKDGQACIVIQSPFKTATREPLYGYYRENVNKFESVKASSDNWNYGIGYWSDIIYWQPLPSLPNDLLKQINS